MPTTTETRADRTDTKPETNEQADVEEHASSVTTCEECGGSITRDADRGERICSDCGLVVSTAETERGPEWYTTTAGDAERELLGTPRTPTQHDHGLSTRIQFADSDGRGNTLSSRQRRRVQRLRRWDERFRARDSKDRNLQRALGEIDRMAAALGLPERVRETASVIYRRALDDGLLPGRSIEGVATAALYAAARDAGLPRTMTEFGNVSQIEVSRFRRSYLDIQRELNLEVPPPTPKQHLPRVASEAGVSDALEHRASAILVAAQDAGIHNGRHPAGIAAAAVYVAGIHLDEPLSQTEIADAASVSRATVRKRYKELLDLDVE